MTLKQSQHPLGCDELVLSRSRSPKTALSSSLTRRGVLVSSMAALSISLLVFGLYQLR